VRGIDVKQFTSIGTEIAAPHGRAALQVSVLAADRFGRQRKKTPAICDGSSFGRNAASQSQRRKLTTFRPIGLWLFTHSITGIGGPLDREIMLMSLAADHRLASAGVW